MKSDYLEVKELIKRQVMDNEIMLYGDLFANYQKTYFWTNENIRGFINLLEDPSRALIVLSSGDLLFSLLNKGLLNIDTFDTNNMANYFTLGLKKALILKYNYQDFKDIVTKLKNYNISVEELSIIILDLIPYMDSEYRHFWYEIVDYNYFLQKECHTHLNLLLMLTLNYYRVDILYKLDYLKNEEEYNKLRCNLLLSNITFTNCNGLLLNDNFSNPYDLVYLSNIMDYFYPYHLKEFNINDALNYVTRISKLLNKDGLLLIDYLFAYQLCDFTEEANLVLQQDVLFDSKIDLLTFIEASQSSIITFPHLNLSNIKSAMMYKRIK